MRAERVWVIAVAVGLAVAWPAVPTCADDDRPAEVERPRQQAVNPGIDLAAHLEVNVLLPPNHWRIHWRSGDLQNIVMPANGRLAVEGNLTLTGEPLPVAPERLRRTDDAVSTLLRQAQRDRLAAIVADRGLTAAQRRALELAMEADIRRVFSELAAARARHAGRLAQLGDDEWREFQKDVVACRRSIADPFGDESLFVAVRAGFEAGP